MFVYQKPLLLCLIPEAYLGEDASDLYGMKNLSEVEEIREMGK
jgi:hypothetical protein